MVTLYDVAREAGVSTATVSRVVHGQDRVRDSTRLRVNQVIEQLGYVPDGAAQSLSRRRKEIIGFVCVESHSRQYDVENMNLLYYDEVMRGVGAGISDRGWSLLITYVNGEDERDFPRLQALTGKVDGILIGQSVVPSPLLARLAERVPVVVIAGAPGDSAADVVTADNRSGSAALVTHLIEVHGRRRLFHVDGPAGVADARERRLGMEQVLRAHPACTLIGTLPGTVQRAERRGSRAEHARPARGCAPGRRRVRQRPDGDRRPAGADGSRRPGAVGHGHGWLR